MDRLVRSAWVLPTLAAACLFGGCSSKTATAVVVTPLPVTVSVYPVNADMIPGSRFTFQATVNGSQNPLVHWRLLETPADGGIDANTGLFTAPTAEGTYHVVATSYADATAIATAEVLVQKLGDPGTGGAQDNGIAVSPGTATIAPAGTVQLSAVVHSSLNQSVAWTVLEGSTAGTISAGGLFTASNNLGTWTVVATSLANSSVTGTALLTVSATSVRVAVSPVGATIGTGRSVGFGATVTHATDTHVTWSLKEGLAAGSISAEGVYTASSSPGTYTVVATSVEDTRASASAKVKVIVPPADPNVQVTVAPLNAVLDADVKDTNKQLFTATVTGTLFTNVTWKIQEGAAGGQITADGLYRPVDSTGAAVHEGTYHVVATSVSDPSKTGVAVVTIKKNVGGLQLTAQRRR